MALAEMLEAAGFHVVVADDAEEAAGRADGQRFDVAVIDHALPASHALRQILRAARPELPVVMITDDPDLIGT